MAYLRNDRAVRGVLVVSFATLLLFGCAWADTLRIGAWNIEELCKAGCAKSATDLAHYIADSGAKVVGLEEITITHKDQEGYYRNRVLDDVVRLLWEQDGHTWTYVLFRTSCEWNPDDKNLGVLFDKHRVTATAYLRLPVPAEEYHQHDHKDGPARHRILCRAPGAIWFQVDEDQTDFVLIPLHLKANEPSQPHPEQIIDHRRVEAARILEALSALSEIGAGSEEDIYIGGDTNILDHEDADMKVFLDNGFVDLNAGDRPT